VAGATAAEAPPGGQLTLTAVAGRSVGLSLPIGAEPLVLGRAQEGDATLGGDPELSREHARVEAFEGGQILIEDLGSTNGTFVNGGRVAGPTVLKDGDVVWIGTTTLLVRAPGSALPEVTPVEPPTPSAQGGFMARIAEMAVHKPKKMLIGLGIFFLLCIPLGGPVTQQLRDEGGFLDPSQESVEAEHALAAASGEFPGPRAVVLFRAGKDVEKDPGVKREVLALKEKIEEHEKVARVINFYEFNDHLLLSRDGKTTYLGIVFKNIEQEEREEAAEEIESELESAPKIVFGGQAVANRELRETVEGDLRKAEALAFPILLLVSLFVFRSLIAALLPIFVGVITIFGSFFVLRIIDSIGTVNVFALNVVTALGLGLAIDYSLFMVSRYREELAKVGAGRPDNELYGAGDEQEQGFAGSKDEALRRTVFTAGRTILFSSVTVALALLALTVFPQPFLYSMGIGGAAAAMVAVLVSLVALPAVLSLLGPRINSFAPKRFQRAAYRSASQEKSGPWYRLSQAVMRRPLPIALLSALLMIAVGLSFTRIDFTGVNAEILPTELQAKQVSQALSEEFPADPSAQVQIAVEAGPGEKAEVEKFARAIEKVDGVAAVFPPRSVNPQYWQIDVQPWEGGLSDATVSLLEDVRALEAPFPVTTTGESSEFVDERASLGSRLPVAIALLAITTFVVLFVMTGSVVLPAKSVVMNLLTIAFTLGVLVLIFQDGRFEDLLAFESNGKVDIAQPILICAIAFGLSTDYAVFLLGRIAEARTNGASDNEAVAIGIERTGRIVTQAAILFCIAIGAFATSSVIFIKEDGVGTAAAVLIDSTIVRALLVPSLMAMLGKRNWWAPRPLQRLHGRVGLSEG
jgi:uncharacterized membrane protein YdfJ with MMPL/SSD domain